MILYNSDQVDEIIEGLSNYVYTRKSDNNLEGIFLFAYNSDSFDTFEIVQVWHELEEANMEESARIGNSEFVFFNINVKMIKNFDLSKSHHILFDRNGKLEKAQENIEDCECASNEYKFSNDVLRRFNEIRNNEDEIKSSKLLEISMKKGN